MIMFIIAAVVMFSGVTGSLNVTESLEADTADMLAHPNSVPEFTEEETEILGQV
ncbi:latexin isoform X1 [Xyrichtys novacula]|uniref:Latexin isoform X1 n=1 Tax=Xyrichtys novacula TaxID=13765 RepID=A0AAV1FYM9_XYRNO|nr:latexin isoform X1 [Xyrichtys novacula]